MGLKHDDALQEIVEAAEACAAGGRPAPFAAAEAAATTLRILRSTLPTVDQEAGHARSRKMNPTHMIGFIESMN